MLERKEAERRGKPLIFIGSSPKDYKRETGKDIGRMLREAQKVQDSGDGAALQDLINGIRGGKFNN